MKGSLKGLVVTLKTALRRPVTAQYPDADKRMPLALRFMGFPALTWDEEVGEPYCTGCMVCVRECPTQCMKAQMKDNPAHEEGRSNRRKVIDAFEINLGRCILCGICVDVCNLDAIEMSHDYELSVYERNANRMNLAQLLERGRAFQRKTDWQPKQEKNRGRPKPKEEARKGAAGRGPLEGAAQGQPAATLEEAD